MWRQILLLACVASVSLAYNYHRGKVAVRVVDGLNIKKIAEQYGYEYVRAIPSLKGHHILQKKNFTAPVEVEQEFSVSELTHTHHHDLVKHPHVEWVEAQVGRTREKRSDFSTPRDPMYRYQWHLDWLNVKPAWRSGYTGRGVQIAVVDDGLESTHPEFSGRYSAEGSYDFNHYGACVTHSTLTRTQIRILCRILVMTIMAPVQLELQQQARIHIVVSVLRLKCR